VNPLPQLEPEAGREREQRETSSPSFDRPTAETPQ
jgi:hypothetical protein